MQREAEGCFDGNRIKRQLPFFTTHSMAVTEFLRGGSWGWGGSARTSPCCCWSGSTYESAVTGTGTDGEGLHGAIPHVHALRPRRSQAIPGPRYRLHIQPTLLFVTSQIAGVSQQAHCGRRFGTYEQNRETESEYPATWCSRKRGSYLGTRRRKQITERGDEAAQYT